MGALKPWIAAAGWLALVGLAQAQECRLEVEITSPFEGAVRLILRDPCRAGQPLVLRHEDARIVRFADETGTVSLLRLLDPDRPDRILVETDEGERVVFAEGEAATAAAPPPAAEETAAAPGKAESPERVEATAEKPPAKPTPKEVAPPPAATAAAPPSKEKAAQEPKAPKRRMPAEVVERAPGAAARAPSPASVCALTATAEVRDGLARVRFAGPCPAGTPVTVRVQGWSWVFHRSLDARGRGEVVIPLPTAELEVQLVADGGPTRTLRLVDPQHPERVRILLVWESAADLDLHVLEPGGRLGRRARHLWAANPDGGGLASGRIERSDDGRRLGTKIESYRASRRELRGVLLRPYAVYASRGRTTAPPHCSGGELASPSFTMVVVMGERRQVRRFRFRPVSCGVRLSNREYYLPLGRVRVR